MKSDVETYGASHQNIIVAAGYGAVAAVGTPLIAQHLIESLGASLGVERIAHDAHESRDNHGFGDGIRMESEFSGIPPANILRAACAHI